jgi:acetylornithine deacetylase/succinyl-diaminopimelate desuccinylase-like protein
VLFYGHYDVQPPDPLELWTSPPFEPQLVDGPRGKRIVARGAVDDKGQTTMFLEALRAWHDAGGGIPAKLTVLIEGEEEVGSRNLEPFLIANKADLKSDVALISDTNMWDFDTPAMTTSLRGMTYVQLTVKAAKRDLHSGLYGGSALNPINAITRILGDLQDENGRIQLPGFYDKVKPISNAQRAQWDSLGSARRRSWAHWAVHSRAGERGYSALERLWARPTADINGIWGGYTGAGRQDGDRGGGVGEDHLPAGARPGPGRGVRTVQALRHERLPAGATAEFEGGHGSPGVEVNADSPWVRAAQAALGEEYGKPAVLIGCGGSIPVVVSLKKVLGIDTLLMGFGLDDDQIHSPNEKFELRCFHHGIRSHVRLLAKFAAG